MAGKKSEAGGIISVNTGAMSWIQFCCLPWTFQMPGSFSISDEAGTQCLEQAPVAAARCATHHTPSLWSIFLFPDVTEAIQAENVFCSLCICSATNINVSSLLMTRNNPSLPALPAFAPSPLCHQLSLQSWSNQLPLSACSKYQMALPMLVSIFVWIKWMKSLIEGNY